MKNFLAVAGDLNLANKVLFLLLLPISVQFICAVFFFQLSHSSTQCTGQLERARHLVFAANNQLQLIYDVGKQMISYRILSSSPAIQQRLDDTFDTFSRTLDEFTEEIGHSASSQEQARKINVLGHQLIEELQDIRVGLEISTRASPSVNERFEPLMTEYIREVKNVISASTKETQVRRQQAEQLSVKLHLMLVMMLIGNLFLAIILFMLFRNHVNSRLRNLHQNSQRALKGESLLPALTGNDDVSQIDQVLHAMVQSLLLSSQRERNAIANVPAFIFSLSADYSILLINPAMEFGLGHSGNDVVGLSIERFFSAEALTAFHSHLQSAQNKSSVSFELPLLSKDNKALDCQWAVHWSEPEKIFFCVGADIRDRKALEQMKASFYAMIAHDLRTPLSSISASLALLQRGIVDVTSARGKEIVDSSELNLRRLLNMINDLLDVEKLSSGTYSLCVDDVWIQRIFVAARSLTEPLAESRNITLVFHEGDKLVQADEERLVRVMVNLLSNAIKHSPARSRVEVGLSSLTDFAEVTVRDYGRGVPEEWRERIFQQYEQVDRSDETQRGGTGLGLAICKKIIEGHGGKIGCRSVQDGTGSVFWFTVPSMLDAQETAEVEESGHGVAQNKGPIG